MRAAAFAGLTPAADPMTARWVVDALRDRSGVANVVPTGYDAYVRIQHRLDTGSAANVTGNLPSESIDLLTPVLSAATTTPDRCHYGLWVGWGELHAVSNSVDVYFRVAPNALVRLRNRYWSWRWHRRDARRQQHTYTFVDSCPRQSWWGGRDMLLMDGPAHAVATLGARSRIADRVDRRSPQWWWPDDRRWFFANEIDHAWSYLGGAIALIEQVEAIDGLETVRVTTDDER